MTVAVRAPRAQPPEAGVIEDARARQRRHRGRIAAGAGVAAACAALAAGFGGSGGRSAAGIAAAPRGHRSARLPATALASCNGRVVEGPPSNSLLAILGVLRRPATAADTRGGISGGGLVREVFASYVRRTRVIGTSSYYVYPAVLGGCGTGERPHQGVMEQAAHVNLGAGLIGGVGGGGSTAAQIEQGREVGSGPPGSSISDTITMIVPDGVAAVTIHYPAAPASGYTRRVSPAVTITAPVVENELVVRVPRSGGPEAFPGVRMTWRAADGRVERTFNRL